MRLGIVLVHKMHIIGTYQLDAEFLGILYQLGVHLLLHPVGVMVGAGHRGLMPLQLQIEVVSEELPVPPDGLLGLFQLSGRDAAGNLPTQTGRTHNQPLVVFLQFHAVGPRTHVEAFRPCLRHQLDQVVIPLLVLGQHHQVITALVGFPFLII